MAVLFLTNETVEPEVLTLLRSLKIEKALEQSKIERRLYLTTQESGTAEPWVEEALEKAKGEAAVCLVYAKSVKVKPMPKTAEQLERLINGIL
jgi:coenzyme F420-reducing hydrogenase beta subunit